MIRLGCCTFVLGRGLEDSLRLARDLGFQHVDVSASRIGPAAQVDQDQAVLYPDRLAATTRELLARYGLSPDELFNTRLFVNGKQAEINDPDPSVRAAMLPRFQRLCAFAVQAGFKSIMGVPGTPQPAWGPERAWQTSVEMLRAMCKIARVEGIRFNVEPHTGSILETPSAALAMTRAVPELAYTLDYSHFVSLGYPESEVAPLHAHAAHVHARQASKDHLYATMADGSIDFASIISALRQAEWDGTIAVEYSTANATGLRDNTVVQNVLLACRIEDLIAAR
jgi:sugar phosphate isomerase/epimerase